ncbi:MAG: fibronectin type III domain-containing protein [Eubacterium sp.]|nr:fibronectin type III domain-containing protein [Eubacterium sp.]
MKLKRFSAVLLALICAFSSFGALNAFAQEYDESYFGDPNAKEVVDVYLTDVPEGIESVTAYFQNAYSSYDVLLQNYAGNEESDYNTAYKKYLKSHYLFPEGYELRYYKKGDAKNAKTVKVTSSNAKKKKLTSLKAGKRYVISVRGYATYNGAVIYSTWSSDFESEKVEKNTLVNRKKAARALTAYKKIKKRAKKWGWKTGILSRKTQGVVYPGGSSYWRIYTVHLENKNYDFYVDIDPRYEKNKDGSVWKFTYFYWNIFTREGGLVKDFSLHMARSNWGLKKRVLPDITKYSVKYKKPRLSVESIYQGKKGTKVVLKMLNTKKKVKWSIPKSVYVKAEETWVNNRDKDYGNGIKLINKKKKSVTLYFKGTDMPNYVQAKIGKKTYLCEIINN